ncbi:MAG: hypothetical protein OXI61_02410 [Candidatus Poribacteria bacterium]|nr:hypothetical protein [Candidatus Poribacteria bacterium]
MIRFLCYLYIVAIICCGCTDNPQNKTFKERYNAYADPQLDYEEVKKRRSTDATQWSPDATLFNYAWHLRDTDVPINELEDFADAIIRRMDAKNLEEYLEIQDEIDLLYFWLTDKLSAKRAYEKYLTPSRHWESFEAFTRDIVLWRFYIIRDEEGIQKMLATLEYYKFLLSFDPDDASRIRRGTD